MRRHRAVDETQGSGHADWAISRDRKRAGGRSPPDQDTQDDPMIPRTRPLRPGDYDEPGARCPPRTVRVYNGRVPSRLPPLRRAARWCGLALAVYAVALASFFLLQRKLLYHPAPASVERLAVDGLKAWPDPATGLGFRGLVAEPAGVPRATAIVLHGNAGHVGHRRRYAEMLTPLGLRVILAEAPGYGPRAGSVDEDSLVSDAAQTIALARRQYAGPLLLIGESLGSGVAAAAAARQPDALAGLLLILPWDRLAHVAAHHYPWLPAGWLLRDRYDSVDHLAGFTRPVLVAVAGRDELVPARYGIALHAALRGPKRLHEAPQARHGDWYAHVDQAWWRDAVGFLLGDPGASARPAPR
jgi:pimeloyl-ACP methyl ester carboxylesterase